MAVLTRPLSASEVQKAKPAAKDYELFDGQGLTLFVKTNGKKTWRFRYKRPGSATRTTLTLGHYPVMSLASARTLHAEKLALLVQGVDPGKLAQEAAEQEKIATDSLFINVATKWFALKKTKGISDVHADDIWKSLEKDVFPAIGQTPVTELKAHTLIAALEPVRARGALETLRRLTQRINEVMKFAINSGQLEANPASTIGDVFEKPKTQHMASIPPERLPELMLRFENTNLALMTRCLLKWQLLTLVRPGEAAGTMWSEIDTDRKIWTIPAERMKKRREHKVPLSPQAIAVVEQLRSLGSHSPFVFPGRVKRSQPMNSETVNKALWRMGFGGELVSHGFRALGCTAMIDAGFPADVVDAVLAHARDKDDGLKMLKPYDRSTHLAQRVAVMDWWGRQISEASVAARGI